MDHIQHVLESAAAQPHGEEAGGQTWSKRFDRALLAALRTVWRAIPPSPALVEPSMRTPLRWCAVSALAQGADAIVAEAVLARPDSRLRAILPFDAEDFGTDFASQEHLDTFHRLLARDPGARVVGAVDGTKATRNRLYREAGEAVVHGCDILIAIWDGEPAKGEGGTGDIVQHALEHGRLTLWIDAKNPESPVKRLVPRSEIERESAEPLPWTTAEVPALAKALSLGFHQISAYNRDMAVGRDAVAEKFAEKRATMLEAARKSNLPETALGEGTWTALAQYCRADQLALRYQSLHLRSAKGLYQLAAFGVTVSVIQVLFFPAWYGLVALEVAAMLAVLLILRISRKEIWHEKWLHDRHFAERLRGRMYLDLLGEDSAPGDARAAASLAFYSRPADWVTLACANLEPPSTRPPQSGAEWIALRDFIYANWVSAQAKYHIDNAERKVGPPKRTHWIGAGLFTATLLAALLHAIGVGHGSHGDHHGVSTVTALLFATTVLLPLWGATLHAIDSLHDWHRMASRSERMGRQLQNVAEGLKNAATPEEIRRQVRTAYEIMATENQEWAASLAFRGPTLPA
ncbi:MAG: hypothetical protein KJ060_13125 [Candidatus Hydrogenedentes bacterium]|nr:hypothetical protein [Candidatus Hydrogenedentota bacterium]